MFTRALTLPPAGKETFFLWGARQTGKTTLLRATYPDAPWIDLLKSDEFRRYAGRPETLREELVATGDASRLQVVIDEVQKVPALLDEVHWLIENTGHHFALCGSSARAVKGGGANLLGGRAFRYELRGLTAHELGSAWGLDRLLDHGYLPRACESDQAHRLLDSYLGDYLKEEIAAEGLVRNLPAFSDFLDLAALSDGELVTFSTIARECGVSAPTVKNHFQILVDTLLGNWVPAYRSRPKRRVIRAPKFYFTDAGTVNRLARRGSGIEVDFIVGSLGLAVEAKSGTRVTSDHLKGLRALAVDQPGLGRRIVVCREPRARTTDDGIEILPAAEFVERLWAGHLIQ